MERSYGEFRGSFLRRLPVFFPTASSQELAVGAFLDISTVVALVWELGWLRGHGSFPATPLRTSPISTHAPPPTPHCRPPEGGGSACALFGRMQAHERFTL